MIRPQPPPSASLLKKAWLIRKWNVTTPSGQFVVEYSGRGVGCETVFVDGVVAVEKQSFIWFLPHFEFQLGDSTASVDIRVWPWVCLRAVRLTVDNTVTYSEGFPTGQPTKF